jgi:hypothetical protein
MHAWFHTACRKLKISKTLSRYKELIACEIVTIYITYQPYLIKINETIVYMIKVDVFSTTKTF